MKFIKTFEELDFNKQVKTKWKVESIPGGVLRYSFMFKNKLFGLEVCKKKRNRYDNTGEPYNPIPFDEIIYGLIKNNKVEYEDEIALTFREAMDLMAILSKIIIEFIHKYYPEIVMLKHSNKDYEEVDAEQMNKKSRVGFQFLKANLSKIPGYVFSYYAAGNIFFSDKTFCFIYKPEKEEDVKFIAQFAKKLI